MGLPTPLYARFLLVLYFVLNSPGSDFQYCLLRVYADLRRFRGDLRHFAQFRHFCAVSSLLLIFAQLLRGFALAFVRIFVTFPADLRCFYSELRAFVQLAQSEGVSGLCLLAVACV